jgi:hypothetical protein
MRSRDRQRLDTQERAFMRMLRQQGMLLNFTMKTLFENPVMYILAFFVYNIVYG